jgi:hypothetical protein
MVESIEELKKICYRPKKETGMVLAYRKVSFYFTKLLLYTPISANQVSIAAMLIGLIGSFLLIFNNIILDILAVIMLYMWFMGDFCDGEIARYRGTAGSKGIGPFLDWLNVYSIPPILFLFLSLRLYLQFLNPFVFIPGIFASFFWFLSYTFVHLKDVFLMIFQSKSHVTKRIKTSLSKKHSKVAFKIVFAVNKIFDSPTIIELLKKDKIPKTPKYEKLKRKGLFVKIIWGLFAFFHEILENYYLPVYINVIVILEILITYFYGVIFNFWYIFLVLIAIFSPLVFILKQTLSKFI